MSLQKGRKSRRRQGRNAHLGVSDDGNMNSARRSEGVNKAITIMVPMNKIPLWIVKSEVPFFPLQQSSYAHIEH